MNKGTAIVGFILTFTAGAGLTWGVTRHETAGLASSSTPRGEPSGKASSPIPIGSDDPTWGDAAAPVTLVVISDFECPFCARVTPTLARAEKEYGPERLRIVWKNNPLTNHANARPAAEAAAAVHALGGDFWKFHDRAFAHQRELTRDNFARWAVEARVDAGRFDAELKTRRSAAKVDRDMAFVRQIGARGTPYFLVNGKPISGAQPFQQFKQLIDQQLTAADALARAGVARADLSPELTRKNFKAPEPQKPKDPSPPPVDTTIWKVPVHADDPVEGPADALVTIIEFSDFQCPYCTKVGPTLDRLRQEYPRDVRIVWKDMPMSFHPRARPAALLSRFAYDERGDEAFWKIHDALFENQKTLDDPTLQRIAEGVGLDGQRALKALATPRYARKIDQSTALASDFAIPARPTSSSTAAGSPAPGLTRSSSCSWMNGSPRRGPWSTRACAAPTSSASS